MANVQLTHQSYKHEKKKFPIYLVLDNVSDIVNVGSAFRLSDALGVSKIYICGTKPIEILKNKKLTRVSRNTIHYVDYEICDDTKKCIRNLQLHDITVLALELTTQSIPIQNYSFEQQRAYAFVVGNEQDGVSQEALDTVDDTVHIDMFGNNSSMNVSVATGIAISQCVNKIRCYVEKQ